MRRARCGDTERGERGAEPRNEEKQDGSITRYEALPRNVMEQVRLCIMNKIHMEEKPSIPRQSHGTRRTMCENTEREEQGAETRNEKSKVRRHGTRRARCGDTEREEQDAEPRNEEKQDGSITRYEALPRNGTSQALPQE